MIYLISFKEKILRLFNKQKFQALFLALKSKFSKTKPIRHPSYNSHTPVSRYLRNESSVSRDLSRNLRRENAVSEKNKDSTKLLDKVLFIPRKVFSIGFFKSKLFLYIFLPIFILLMLVSYGYYTFAYASGSRVNIRLTYKFVPISKTKNISITKNTTNGPKIVELTAESSASEFVDATGERGEGERALGEVSIFNPTTEIKEIPAGTIITCISAGCSGLTFTMNTKLNVGPGESESVKVTAGDIGLEYNLSPGSGKFQIGNYDSSTELVSQNIKAFSGGTKKEIIKIIKLEDIEKAETQAMEKLNKSLLSKIKSDPKNKDYTIADSSFKSEKVESKPDKKEGEEANIVNVSVKAKGAVNAFANAGIKDIVEQLKKDATPTGYYLDEAQTKVSDTKVISQTAESIEISVGITSIARPTIDLDKIKEELAGKHFSEADGVLSSVPNTTEFKKDYSPQTLPEYFWKIPVDKNRIRVELVAEGSN